MKEAEKEAILQLIHDTKLTADYKKVVDTLYDYIEGNISIITVAGDTYFNDIGVKK